MISAVEKTTLRRVSKKINEMHIPNQKPIVEYTPSEFKPASSPIVIPNSKRVVEENGADHFQWSPSPKDGFLANLKQRLCVYY